MKQATTYRILFSNGSGRHIQAESDAAAMERAAKIAKTIHKPRYSVRTMDGRKLQGMDG